LCPAWLCVFFRFLAVCVESLSLLLAAKSELFGSAKTKTFDTLSEFASISVPSSWGAIVRDFNSLLTSLVLAGCFEAALLLLLAGSLCSSLLSLCLSLSFSFSAHMHLLTKR
jgi:hypothetical protein